MNKLPLFLSFLFVALMLATAIPLPASAASSTTVNGQAADIMQNNIYTWIGPLFSTGYKGTAEIPSGIGKVQYTANLLAPSDSVAEIQILSLSGQVLSTAEGTGYYVSDTFNFSFVGNSEYEMLLYYNNATAPPSNTIATTTNGILAESSDGYVYDYSTNTQSSGTVFTFTSNITSSDLQATIYVIPKEKNIYTNTTLVFTETGLPAGTPWTVALHAADLGYTAQNFTQSSTTKYDNITIAMGQTVYYWVNASNGDPAYPSHGILDVGSAVTSVVGVTFTTKGPAYPVTFTPVGMPSGVTWGVTLLGTGIDQTLYNSNMNGQNADIVFAVVNGTYDYSIFAPSGYVAQPSTGQIAVNGAGLQISISISQPGIAYHSLIFSESGLPSNVTFTVSIGTAVESGNPSVVFTVPNGTYYYTISSVDGYTPSPNAGSVVIPGNAQDGNAAVLVNFTQKLYSVTFTESGLPSGMLWGISLGGTSLKSQGTYITFSSVASGTYSYTAAASGYLTVTGSVSVPSSSLVKLSFISSVTMTAAPVVTITSAKGYEINGTLQAPSGYNLSQFTFFTVNMSWNSSWKNLDMMPSPAFSIQVPSLNTSYRLSMQLVGSNLRSSYLNITVKELPAYAGTYLPSAYSFYPATGSVVYSSESIGIFLKGNVTFSGILIYSGPYGASQNITLESKNLANGTQSLYYPMNINNFSEGQYDFKYVILYQGKVQTALTAQYFIEAQNAITLKYVYDYSETPSGVYNVSFNISVVDNNSIRYSPVNILNVSIGKSFWYLNGKPVVTNGITRDYFVLTVNNLPRGSYVLNITAFNRTGNIPYAIFSTEYNFTVPSLPPTVTGGFNWQDARSWLQQGYNEYYIAAIAAVLIIGAMYAYSTGSFTGSRIPYSQGSQQKPQGINIRIVNSAPKSRKSKRRSK